MFHNNYGIYIGAIESTLILGAYPSLEEQEKLGQYFGQLDTLISLYQYKINEMKEYKKGLLQQMFV